MFPSTVDTSYYIMSEVNPGKYEPGILSLIHSLSPQKLGGGGGERLGITGSYFILRREPGDEAK